jgi:hypothetical protein
MYFDLFLPFPVVEPDQPKKKNNKGKNKQNAQQTATVDRQEVGRKSCWDGLRSEEKDAIARDIALTGHCEFEMSNIEQLKADSKWATRLRA